MFRVRTSQSTAVFKSMKFLDLINLILLNIKRLILRRSAGRPRPPCEREAIASPASPNSAQFKLQT